MSNEMHTPLKRAKGWGSAKSGTHHFWVQRLTALALIPLSLWFCFGIASLPSLGYADFIAWMQTPYSAIMMIMTLAAVFYHYALGLQVIIEDYVSDHAIRTVAIVATYFFCIIVAITGIFSVLHIAFGA